MMHVVALSPLRGDGRNFNGVPVYECTSTQSTSQNLYNHYSSQNTARSDLRYYLRLVLALTDLNVGNTRNINTLPLHKRLHTRIT